MRNGLICIVGESTSGFHRRSSKDVKASGENPAETEKDMRWAKNVRLHERTLLLFRRCSHNSFFKSTNIVPAGFSPLALHCYHSCRETPTHWTLCFLYQ